MSTNTVTAEEVRDIVVSAIESLVLPRFDEHDQRFDALESDMAQVKDDVRVLKDDVRVLKDDVRQIKADLQALEGRVQGIENDVRELYDMVAKTQKSSKGAFDPVALEKLVTHTHDDVLFLARTVGVRMT